MNNELALNIQQIIVIQGIIQFNEFENVKQQAIELAEQIGTVVVNEENIKESKKLLAAVNKRLKELEDKRINIKKTMLEPYQVFEDQVKEIVKIVKDADDQVRQAVKYLEEFERLQKEEALETLFNKRKEQYCLGSLITFEKFLKPKHLNKTASIESTEKEMVEFLEQTEKDMKVIKTMENSKAIVSAYICSFDLAQAITHVNEQEQLKKAVEASGAIENAVRKERYAFVVFEAKDFRLLKLFMEQNEIKFEVEDEIK
jgi:hypothetical protein